MPFQRQDYDDGPLVHGVVWLVRDEQLLSRYVARLMVGHYRHLQMLITTGGGVLPQISARMVGQIIPKLRVPPGNGPHRYHRDGWLFQYISWLAAFRSSTANDYMIAPHPQPTSKGFDGLILHLPNAPAIDDATVTITEDKATTDPRGTITDHVWPEFEEYERGEADAQLISALSSLLAATTLPGDHLSLYEDVYWQNRRRYRVAITVAPTLITPGDRKQLFAGYDTIVPQGVAARRGDLFPLAALRDWMDVFAGKVIDELQQMAARTNV